MKELVMLSDGLLQFYADVFHEGNKSDARSDLNSQHNKIRAIDGAGIAFACGGIFMLITALIFFIFAPTD